MIGASHAIDELLIMVNKTEIALATAVGVTCILSMIGSLAIIISYLAFRELKTTVRYLLFNLSIADFIVAVTNLIGALYTSSFQGAKVPDKTSPVCIAQASIGLVGTNASILWTIVFIGYIYIILTWYRPKPRANIIFVSIITLFTWIVPLIVAIVFIAEGYFGYQENYSPAFCTIDTKNRTELVRGLVGYDLFLYTSFFILPVLTALFLIHLCCTKRHAHRDYNSEMHSTLYSRLVAAEVKCVFVPICFILIRVWGLVLDIITFYYKSNASRHNITVLLFLAGIGDSAQGFLNGILFVLLTKSVRDKLFWGIFKVFWYCCCCCCCCCRRTKDDTPVMINSQISASTTSLISYKKSRSDSMMSEFQNSLNVAAMPEKGRCGSLSNISADTDTSYRSFDPHNSLSQSIKSNKD